MHYNADLDHAVTDAKSRPKAGDLSGGMRRDAAAGLERAASERIAAERAGDFAAAVGRRMRSARAKRGMTRRQLAQASRASERYLAQIEGGQGNPSAIVLKGIAEALDVPMEELLPRTGTRSGELDRNLDLLRQMPPSELPAIADLIERRAAQTRAADRAQRVALVGLRGAGKSTLGSRLAQRLGCPFIELDRMVEQEYGARIPDLVEIAGLATFRRYERACLERVIVEHQAAVIATAGGIVSSPETYGLLLRHAHTVWIKARPEEHMRRVMAQGDFRPMAQNREAMADLVAILDARSADYARAEAALDTSGDTEEDSFASLVIIVAPMLGNGRRQP
jgi:XRE family aerobic/anaerobic benzoate catabolism transcriptional regulator